VDGRPRTAGSAPRLPGRRLAAWLGRGLVAIGRGLVFSALTVLGLGPVLAVAVVIVEARDVFWQLTGQRAEGPLLSGGSAAAVVLVLCSLLYVRWLTGQTRRLAGRWCGVAIPSPYRPAPAADQPGMGPRLRWLLTDPASWRDMLWLVVNACAGCALVVAPVALVVYGVAFAILPPFGVPTPNLPYFGILTVKGDGALLLGLALTAAGLALAPLLLPAYGRLAETMLGPTRRTELTDQVQHLVQTRSETIDAGAAELRRIERDLHDGAQARLVAMGMTLDAVDEQLVKSPDAARALLAEAKASSVRALAELRDLVRGIHPPVLADRGLTEAVRALALDSPLRVQVTSDLPGRVPPPVESAAYFAVSELVANAAKHAGPGQAWVDIRHSGGMLRISVTDDGRGGADIARGTGLAGVERRLAAFDGVLAISSPPGGPTVANMEIPCALSSPKTSSS
jgi:signal transduction histidine kinase